MKYRLLADRLIVEYIEEKRSQLLILPGKDIAKQLVQGKVISVGPGGFTKKGVRKPIAHAVGDLVMYKRYAGRKLPHEENLFVIQEEDIIGTMS